VETGIVVDVDSNGVTSGVTLPLALGKTGAQEYRRVAVYLGHYPYVYQTHYAAHQWLDEALPYESNPTGRVLRPTMDDGAEILNG
jgi:hypothetical protein